MSMGLLEGLRYKRFKSLPVVAKVAEKLEELENKRIMPNPIVTLQLFGCLLIL